MNKVVSALSGFVTAVKNNPAVDAGLVNFGVFAGGYFGLHVTAEQLVAFAGVLDVLFSVVVRSYVTPVSKLPVTVPVTVVPAPVLPSKAPAVPASTDTPSDSESVPEAPTEANKANTDATPPAPVEAPAITSVDPS